MADQPYLPRPSLNGNSKEKRSILIERTMSPYSTGQMTPLNLGTPYSTQVANLTHLIEKQKLNGSDFAKNSIEEDNIFAKSNNKSFSMRSSLGMSNNRNHKFDQTIFDMADNQIGNKIRKQTKSSYSISIQKYKDLISNTSPTTMHLPAQRTGQERISEISNQDLSKTVKDGFTSFYSIKAQNQDFLISLHQTRKSITNLVDLGDLEAQRSFNKKKEQKQELPKVQKVQKQPDYILQYTYENKDHIQMELEHNKAMQRTFISSHEKQLVKKNRDVFADFIVTEEKLLKMPPIRKYPIQRRKDTQNMTLPKEDIEMDQKLHEIRKIEEEIKTQLQGYKVYLYTIPQNDWKPSAREGASLVVDKNKAYLFGGLGQNIFNSLEVLDLEQNLKWKTFEHTSAKNNVPPPRFGHTMNYLKGQLIVFGGETHFNTSFKQRQCLFDIHILNIELKKWQFVNVSGDIPFGRRCHTAAIVGRWLIIHGGSNFRDKTLSDLWAFDLGTQSWQELVTVSQDMSKNKYTAVGHSCCPVFYSARQNKLQLYKYIDIKIPKWISQIQYEGIYYFGGKDEVGNIMNILRILKVDQNPIGWVFPQTNGQTPAPRFSHSMTYNQLLNSAIICGGRNDDSYLNDIQILQIETLTWLKVDLKGAEPLPRASHCTVGFDSKLFIFGGLNDYGYLNSQVQMIELDETLSKQMITKDEQKKKFIYEENLKIQKMQLLRDQKNALHNQKGQNKRKSILESSGYHFYQDHHNFDYGDIPFSSKLIQEQEENTTVKHQIEKLNYNNFISFLPLPSKANKTFSRLQHNRTLSQLIKKPSYHSPSAQQTQNASFSENDKPNKNEQIKEIDSPPMSPSQLLLQRTVNKILTNLKHHQ